MWKVHDKLPAIHQSKPPIRGKLTSRVGATGHICCGETTLPSDWVCLKRIWNSHTMAVCVFNLKTHHSQNGCGDLPPPTTKKRKEKQIPPPKEKKTWNGFGVSLGLPKLHQTRARALPDSPTPDSTLHSAPSAAARTPATRSSPGERVLSRDPLAWSIGPHCGPQKSKASLPLK